MSLRDIYDQNDKLGEIFLELQHETGQHKVWVLVEGTSDVSLYCKLIRGASVEEMPGGVHSLQTALTRLCQRTNRVLGIRDADYLILRNICETTPNLFITDAHDGEMMMLSHRRTQDAPFAEYLPEAIREASQLFQKILESVKFLGCLRLLNDIQDMRLNFQGLSIEPFYSALAFKLDEVRCLDEVNKRSSNKRRVVELADVRELLLLNHDPVQLCCGHDVIKVFALYLSARRACLAKSQKKGVSVANLEAVLRSSYDLDAFSATQLYQSLIHWSDHHQIPLFNQRL